MSPKQKVLFTIALVSIIEGSVGQYFYPDSQVPPSTLWLIVVFSFLIFLWYRIDAKQFEYPRSVALNIGVFALHFVALPYYLFRSRGLKKGFVAVGLYVLAFLGAVLLSTSAAIFMAKVLQS